MKLAEPTDPGKPSEPDVTTSIRPVLPLVDQLVGPRRYETTPARLLRKRLLVSLSVFLTLSALAFIIATIGMEAAPRLAYGVMGLCIAIVAAAPLWLRLTSVRRASLLVLLTLNVALVYGAWLVGGTGGPLGSFLICIPTFSAVLLGVRSGLLNALALMASAALAIAVDPSALAPTDGMLEHGPMIPLLSSGLSMLALLGVVSFFSELHSLQAKHFAADRDHALALNDAKSRFLSVMSHELRTPMVGVLGAVDLLERSKDPAEQRQLIGVLRRSAQAQLKLIGNILDFSQSEAELLELEEVALDLHQLLGDLSAMFRTAAEAKGLSLTINIADDLPRRIVGDSFRLQQVLSNLVSNAIKFTEQGEVQVRAQSCPDQRVMFTVRDTGIGFPSALGEDIFVAFVQADNTTARRFGGSGLGLAICRRLVTAMGGRIEARSSCSGSTFEVVLPARAPSDSAEFSIPQCSASGSLSGVVPSRGRATVLLADDETVNRLILSTMLRTLGHRVLEAANGREALEILAREEVDLLLLDMHMPEIDGPGVVDRIRSERGERASLPVVGITADVVKEHLDQYLEHGLDEILCKPISIDGLREAVDRALGDDDGRASSASLRPAASSGLSSM